MKLRLGYSFCPNDTYIFHALTHGLVDGVEVEEVLADVETLNQWAREARLELTKVSYHAYFHVMKEYVALSSGGALGRGVGPLLVARPGQEIRRIAIPGRWTTAYLLLRLAFPSLGEPLELRYDHIIPAVLEGRVDAGVIIHESRFAFQQYGLEARLDLGQWWEERTQLPLPLGAILARRDLGLDRLRQLDASVRRSLELAHLDPSRSTAYIQQHAQELSPEVVARHIRTYVNDFSLEVGEEGESAVRELLRQARQIGAVTVEEDLPLFVRA